MSNQDTEEFNESLSERNFMGQWEILSKERSEKRLDPYHWKWSEIKEVLDESKEVIDLAEQPQGARRSIGLINPSHHSVARNYFIGVQSVMPDEVARAHRHSLTAFRFVIEGDDDVYTNVEGERFPMKPGDLILTPRMTWHDHVNESDEEAIWVDGVDGPFVRSLGAGHYENYQEDRQSESKSLGYHRSQFASFMGSHSHADDISLGADIFEGDQSHPPSPPYRYPWKESSEALRAASDDGAQFDPVDGTTLEYLNPTTGEPPTLESLSLRLQLLTEDVSGRHKHNSTEVYFVVDGRGTTHVGDNELHWDKNDFFIVPPGEWHSHEVDNDEAILFGISDRPIFESFNIHRRETVDISDEADQEQDIAQVAP